MKLYQQSDYTSQTATLTLPSIHPTQIKGASLNLKIGKIYVPGKDGDELGSVLKPLSVFSLKQGATVVLKTSQEIMLNARQTAIMFPPNHVSLKGLLMTNPGHVDPGFKGHLHVTVINMGSVPYELRVEDHVIRLMVFELDGDVPNPYGAGSDPVTEQLMKNLSFDFFDINNRIKSEIEVQERKTKLYSVVLPVLATMIGIGITFFISFSQYGERISKIEGSASANAITKQLDQTRFELQQVTQKLEQLEKRSLSNTKKDKK
jgi:dCTP deaminase